MRVLIINTSERIGGAAIAASRLMESLKNNGIKAKMLVRDKQTDQISVVRLKSNWLQVWKFMWERIREPVEKLFLRPLSVPDQRRYADIPLTG